MASNFSSAEDTWEGDDCEAMTDVTYYVKEKKKLCKDCVSKEGCIRKAREGGPNLYCEKHDEEIKLYCKTHGVATCYSCAMIAHRHQDCVHQNTEDAFKENKANLKNLKGKAKEKLKLCRANGAQIRQCRQDTSAHLQALKDEVDSEIDDAMGTVKEREQEDAAKINQKIDEKNKKLIEAIQKINDKIQKNNEEREMQLELNHRNAEKGREFIGNKQRGLHTDIQNIAEESKRKIDELEKSWHDVTQSTENTIQTLDTVLEDDKSVVKDGHHVDKSVADELQKPLDEGGVKNIACTVSGVRFMKGAGKEKYNGRIDGYDGEWKRIDAIDVTNNITRPIIVGCIDECNVIITGLGNRDTYMLDMNTKHTQRAISSNTSWIISCVLVKDKVVCGKVRKGCRGDSLTGCISVYDRQWTLINDVKIPRNTKSDNTWVDVAADHQDGMIIAAEAGQTKIYVINPTDGKIMNTITCKQRIVMRGVLSSGHIIAQPNQPDRRTFIIDREGAQREIPHSDVILNVCIDPMTDDLYAVTSNVERNTCMIDQVMSGGDMKKRRVASFPLSIRLTCINNGWQHLVTSRMMMTSLGNIIGSDGDNILVFKKDIRL